MRSRLVTKRHSNLCQKTSTRMYKGGASNSLQQSVQAIVNPTANPLQTALAPVNIASGGLAGEAANSIGNGISGFNGFSAPHQSVNQPDPTAQNAAIANLQGIQQGTQGIANTAGTNAANSQNLANAALNQQLTQAQNLPGAQNQANQAIGTLQNQTSALPAAQQATNDAIALQQQTAQGGGPAQQAAAAQLQQGTDQAIATQHALANSGNLSQMLTGQTNAQANAANLIQQQANQAAQLRAQMSATAQGQLGSTAGANLSSNLANASNAAGAANTNLGTNVSNLAGVAGGANTNLGTNLNTQTSNQGNVLASGTNQLGGQQAIANQALQANLGEAQSVQNANSMILGPLSGAAGGAGGALAGQALAAYEGGIVPGKANVPDKNTLENDTVPVLTSPGELIIPLEQMKSASSAVAFLLKHMEKMDVPNEKEDNEESDRKELFKSKKEGK